MTCRDNERVLILLPPSEGKTAASTGDPCDLARLSFAEALHAARQRQWRRQPPGVRRTPAAPAHSVYSGVLYAAFDYPSLTSVAKRRADASTVVVSALFGAVRLHDRIPAYKATMSNAVWRRPLTEALESVCDGVVVDCRSSTYAGAFVPPRESTVAVRVFKESAGKRTVITHMSKHYRGLIARLLAQTAGSPRTPEHVARIVSEHWRCELNEPAGKQPWELHVIVDT